MSMVETEGLEVKLGGNDVLVDITFQLNPGEVLVVLGMNGAGKSTLLKTLLGLIPPVKGSIRHFGKPISREARRKIGAAFDEPSHWDRLTGWENAYFFSRSYGMTDSDARERLNKLFTWTGLDGQKDKVVEAYSYGMRRKLSIIEALAHQPEVLFLDEPTMGLDHTSLQALNIKLGDMASDGRSVLVTTNDLIEASAIADRVCVLHQGRLMAIGTPGELLGSLVKGVRMEVRLIRPIPMDVWGTIDGVEDPTLGEDPRVVNFRTRSEGGQPEVVLARLASRMNEIGGSVESISVRSPDLGFLMAELSKRGDHAPV
jgi:ABC-type multidrug transport system ATPase subunit